MAAQLKDHGNKMNAIKKIMLSAFVVPFFITGCYTIVWTPEDDFPVADNYRQLDTYYSEEYYYYYDYPWWLSITPPTKTRNDRENRDGNISTLRNNGNGRNSENSRDIINTSTPTKSRDNNNSNTSGNSKVETQRTDSNTNSSNNNSRSNSGSSNSNARNNDGSRNNGRSR